MSIKLDSNKIYNSGIEIKKQAEKYKLEIDSIFSRLENMNSFGDAWVGSSSDKYIEQIRLEKQNYYNFYQNIIDMGESLVAYSNDINLCCDNIRSDINE